MAFTGNVPPVEVLSNLNGVNIDIKRGLRLSEQQIKDILSELADPNKDLIIDGQRFSGADKVGPAATLAVNNKLEQITNQTTTMISVFAELFKLEKSLGGLQ